MIFMENVDEVAKPPEDEQFEIWNFNQHQNRHKLNFCTLQSFQQSLVALAIFDFYGFWLRVNWRSHALIYFIEQKQLSICALRVKCKVLSFLQFRSKYFVDVVLSCVLSFYLASDGVMEWWGGGWVTEYQPLKWPHVTSRRRQLY